MDKSLECLDHVEFVKFLSVNHSLERIKSFLAECTSHVVSKMNEESKARMSDDMHGLGERFYKFEQSQLLEPRGRFDISVADKGLLLEGKVGNCVFPWSSISHVNIVPASVSSKKVCYL